MKLVVVACLTTIFFVSCLTLQNNNLFLPQIDAPIHQLELNSEKIHLYWQVDYDSQNVIFEVTFFQPEFHGKSNIRLTSR